MTKVYLYVLDTLADWEIGHLTAELASGRFFKADANPVQVVRVGCSYDTVTTMGGMRIAPEMTVDQMELDEDTMLVLPGADTWADSKHSAVVDKAAELLGVGGYVAAICGATVALAAAGMLDDRPHTSNGVGFLDMFVPSYKGGAHYVDAPSVFDGNLITAGSFGELLWTKHVLQRLDVLATQSLDAWYEYFQTGDPQQFFVLMS